MLFIIQRTFEVIQFILKLSIKSVCKSLSNQNEGWVLKTLKNWITSPSPEAGKDVEGENYDLYGIIPVFTL
ncbi:MAG: hypothetical protein BGO67_10875 [Alphaproteobacteria bacterium 41-28]|nr:MAG: hypothetical protein BGO67_10875 [Alphaproteobacteria bacterium 41-28]